MKDIQFKWVGATQKVLPTKEPVADHIDRYSLLKEDRLSFQLAYHFQGENKERAKIEVVHDKSFEVSMREVDLVACSFPAHKEYDDDYMTTLPGVYPDLLRDLKNHLFPLVVGQWRSLWIEIKTDANTISGIHQLKFTIEYEGERQEFIKEIEIIEESLEPLPIVHTEWFHTDCIANYYGEEIFSENHWRMIGEFMKVASHRNCNMILTPIFTPPLDTWEGEERKTVQLIKVIYEDGQYQFDFTLFERWVHLALQSGMKYFEMSHLFTQWGAKWAPKIMVYENGNYIRKFFWDTPATSQTYQFFLESFLPALIDKIREMGIEDKCYFHISDEPNLDNYENYKAAREIVSPYLEGFPVMDALSNFEFYQKKVVDIPVCANDHLEPFLEDRPKKLWTYYCTGQKKEVSNRFIVQDGYRTRILGLQLYLEKIDGFLHWGYNFYHSDFSRELINPYLTTDAGGAFPSGDPFLVYPGKDGIPEESIRLLLMDAAMNDLRALVTLEKLSSREDVLRLVYENFPEKITFKHYPRTHEFLIDLRQKVNRKIQSILTNK